MIWFDLALFIASYLVTYILSPKPIIEDRRPATLDDLKIPQATEGAPVAMVLGTVRQRGANTLWYGDFSSKAIIQAYDPGWFKKLVKTTIGYSYFLGFDLGLCLGPDTHLRKIWIDKDVVWTGDAGPDETTIVINAPNLFGGRKQGGGFVAGATYYHWANGNITTNPGPGRFYGGSFSQAKNDYLQDYLTATSGETLPKYNGLAHIVFEKAFIGESASLRAISFELQRFTNDLGLTGEVNVIGDDLNPMEVLYQVLTSDWGGADVDPSEINLVSLREAAEVLKDENLGMSMLINKNNNAKAIIEEILRQVDGILYQDPETAQITIKLVRQDYVIGNLPVFDPSNCVVRNFNRTSWADTYNQLRVRFTKRSSNYEDGIAIVQDVANIGQQSRIRSTDISFPGCTTGELAVALGTRELTQISVPIYNVELELTRVASMLRPGDPFVLNWPKYGISQLVLRVQKFSLGELTNNKVVISALQDRFAVNSVVYGVPEDSLFTPPDRTPVAITQDALIESPYWIMQHQKELPMPPVATNTFMFAMAREPSPTMQGYSVYYTQDNWVTMLLGVDKVTFTPSALLSASMLKTDGFVSGTLSSFNVYSALPLDPDIGIFLKNVATADIQNGGANLIFIDDEIMAYESFTDMGSGVWRLNNVHRALLDTKFLAHSANVKVWFIDGIDSLILAELLGVGATTKARFLSFTNIGEYLFANASDVTKATDQRYDRPLPPDNIRLNGTRSITQSITTGSLITVDFNRRDRLDSVIRFEQDADVTPEASTTVTAYLYVAGVLRDTVTGVTGTTLNVNPASYTGAAYVQLISVRGSLESFLNTRYDFTLV